MIGVEASHDVSTPRSFCTAGDNPVVPLRFTEEEVALLDPLEKLALKMMIKNGKATLEEETR
jgi:hypothetical protein